MGRQLKLGFTPLAHKRLSLTQVRTWHAAIRMVREMPSNLGVGFILNYLGRGVRREAPPACVRRSRKRDAAHQEEA
jgi:hypothetical protein